MTSRDFVFWLQGYFELLDPKMEAAPFPLGPAQVKSIRDHLQLVFTHDIEPLAAAKRAYVEQAARGTATTLLYPTEPNVTQDPGSGSWLTPKFC